jgi:methyl-accepting chemotaxis protein
MADLELKRQQERTVEAENLQAYRGLMADTEVRAGAQLLDRSGHTRAKIVGGVKQVTDLIAEIATASQEQATSAESTRRS